MKIVFLIILLVGVMPLKMVAQQKDSLHAIREFMQVCNVYKQLPLYLNLEYATTSNIVTEEEDSSSMKAEFFLLPQVSYIRFGEIEQIVNDSMALLVSDKDQRMILYPNAQAVVEQMKATMGVSLLDSSLVNFSRRYKSEVTHLVNDTGVINLESRALLYGTLFPKETIEVAYTVKTKIPIRFVTTRRSLVEISESESSNVTGQHKYSGEVIKIEGEGNFIVKKHISTFIYRKISHNDVSVPVLLSDRVKRVGGVYEPVVGYGGYVLTENR